MTRMVLSVVGSDRPGLTRALAAAVLSAGGNWLESHLSQLGGLFVGSVLVEIHAEAVDDLRAADEDGPRDVILDQHLGEPLHDAARGQRPRQAGHAHTLAAAHQKVRDGEAQHEGAVHLGLHGQGRDIGHGGGAIHPDPDRMGRLPLALAHIDPVVSSRAAPVDPRGGFAPDEGAELPEGLAHASALAPMHAMHRRRRDLFGRDQQGRQAARKIQRAALVAGLGRSFAGVQKAGVHHGVSQAARRAAR